MTSVPFTHDQALLRHMVEKVTDFAIFAMDPEGRVATWNSGAETIFGWREADILGEYAAVLFTPEDREIGAPELELTTARLAGRAEDERWHLRKDGSRFYASGSMSPILDHEGVLRGYTKVCRDMTAMKRAEADRKEAEMVLRESVDRFRSLADVAPVILWTTDPQGQCTFLSRSWRELTGQPEHEGLGLGWTKMSHPEDQDRTARAFLDANARQAFFQVDYRVRSADGGYRWAVDLGRPYRDAQGAYAGMVGAVFDIHDRKLAEQALQEEDRRKNEFLAMLAHELRNPLAAVNHALAALEDGASDDDRRWAGEVIGRQVGQLARLVDDLLDVSRITSGKIRLRTERLDAARVLRHAAGSVQPLVAQRGHRLALAIPEDGTLVVEGDPARLEQIVVNLLTNAAKYSEDGADITLSACVETAGDHGRQVCIAVRDTGLGIAPEKLPHVWDLFVQGERSIARSEGGLGIGLTLVRRLTEMHGGSVVACSDGLGHGAEFTVRLPLAAGPAPAAPSAPPPVAAVPAGCRVLVVDDSVDTARGLARLLLRAGYAVEVAHDGPHALQTAATLQPDFVLLDIGLPGMDGYEVAARLRAASHGARCPVLIAVSGYGQDDDRRRSREAGFDHHLVKPVDVAEIRALLTEEGCCAEREQKGR